MASFNYSPFMCIFQTGEVIVDMYLSWHWVVDESYCRNVNHSCW